MLGENSDKIGPKHLDALIWSSDTTGHNIESQIQFSDKCDLAGKLLHCGKVARLWFNPPRYQIFLKCAPPFVCLYFKILGIAFSNEKLEKTR